MTQKQSRPFAKSVPQIQGGMCHKSLVVIALLLSGWATNIWAWHSVINSSERAQPTRATRSDIILAWEGYTAWGDGDNTGCKSLQLSAGNRAMIGPCGGQHEAKEFFAGIEQEWADIENRFAPFTYKTAADQLVFRGKGKLAGPAWQRAVVAWAHSIYGSLYSGRRSATGRNVLEWWLNEVPGRSGKCGLLVVREIGDATASVFPCGQTVGKAEEDFSAWLATNEWEVFDKWLYHRAELCLANNDGSENCLNGKGKRKMSQPERTELSRWAKSVFIRLLRQK